MTLRHYTYSHSSAAYRVRIALNLKGLQAEEVYVSLTEAKQSAPDYAALNPERLVPTLEVDGVALSQSMAILEYLEEAHPDPALLPKDPIARAQARAFADAIACDIHPVNNLRIRKYLADPLGHDAETVAQWYRHWIKLGFDALEERAKGWVRSSGWLFLDGPSFAEICLVPQMYNARRFKLDLEPYPTLCALDEKALALPAFADAVPERQRDAK